ncbi:hypothetical protein [Tautonia sociabilis]|uniref:Uncharacterized protein n=1 Tax=Tautonia sociabilis TaxID=2080755 RepID=A0A432MEZ4_9BACT|nr:hypothetical protein [Tautonia sociabilis]RUL84333.1 hypothetical protein TsocGM_20610 [Tautonia sociabilis]
MGIDDDLSIGPASTVLALFVIGVAFLLTWRQRVETSRRRELDDEADRRFFARQDRRRYRGVVLLALLGLGIGVGGNIDIRAGRGERMAFIATWLVVLLLLGQVMLLAVLDLWATRRYADRQRRRLADDRRRALERELATHRERARRRRRPTDADDASGP